MSEGARVDSIDALRAFRAALLKFAEASNVALSDAEAEMSRLLNSLETEQASHWQSQIRKRAEVVSKAKEAVRQKKVFKDAAGRQGTAIDEEKALRVAQARLEEAEQKLRAVQKYARLLPREIEMYKGSTQRFATTVRVDIPTAVARLERMAGKLEEYVSLRAPTETTSTAGSATSLGASGSQTGSMSRPESTPEPSPTPPMEPEPQTDQDRTPPV